MLQELGKGTVLAGQVSAGELPTEPVQVTTTLDYVNVRLGTELTFSDIEEVFAKLGFGLELELLKPSAFRYLVAVGISISRPIW